MENMIKNKINKFKQFLLLHIEDFLIFIGLFLIIFATFLINKVGGIYATGIILLVLGCYFTRFPVKKRG
jgi:uncharacterized membrane protein